MYQELIHHIERRLIFMMDLALPLIWLIQNVIGDSSRRYLGFNSGGGVGWER
jgi:hypothetical protein